MQVGILFVLVACRFCGSPAGCSQEIFRSAAITRDYLADIAPENRAFRYKIVRPPLRTICRFCLSI